MVSFATWCRYIALKLNYSLSVGGKIYRRGQIDEEGAIDAFWKNFLQGKLTYLHWNKGQDMSPTTGEQGGTLLVRKLPAAYPTGLSLSLSIVLVECQWSARHVFVGDVVILKDPANSKNYLVRRLAAVEGYEMVSTDEKEEPFVLDENQCWVLADNEKLKPKDANDSRTFGPVSLSDIVGRAIYCMRTAVDHGPVKNSDSSMQQDGPVLAVELDVEEMAKYHKA
uniref:Uncharacterized protein MANES_12G032900 n=1 Tax=Rhizophora mucronata TaxID=61149 RepID=A0A2P2JTS4_RHIMU